MTLNRRKADSNECWQPLTLYRILTASAGISHRLLMRLSLVRHPSHCSCPLTDRTPLGLALRLSPRRRGNYFSLEPILADRSSTAAPCHFEATTRAGMAMCPQLSTLSPPQIKTQPNINRRADRALTMATMRACLTGMLSTQGVPAERRRNFSSRAQLPRARELRIG